MTSAGGAQGALAGRTALVTGASRGIGLAISAALASEGARVFMLARHEDVLSSAAAMIGPSAVPLVCDVSDADSVADAVAQVRAVTHGAPDILVNNAGLFPLATLALTTSAQFADTLAVNVLAPFLFVRAFLPDMLARSSGHVITVGSVADRSVFAENGAYSASKHGQRAMHEVLRNEVQGTGVRTSLVSPGPTDTGIWDAIDPDNRPGFPPRSAMLRADDVADAVLWLVTRPSHVNVDELRLSRA